MFQLALIGLARELYDLGCGVLHLKAPLKETQGVPNPFLEMTLPSSVSLAALLRSHAGVTAAGLCEAHPPAFHPGRSYPLHPHRPVWILGKGVPGT